jgi:predicted DNA-binding WGR domain protein
MQGLKRGDNQFYLWTRYGRVGYDGVSDLKSTYMAESDYKKKYKEKTRKNYTEVKMALGKEESKEEAKKEESIKKKKKEEVKTKLD